MNIRKLTLFAALALVATAGIARDDQIWLKGGVEAEPFKSMEGSSLAPVQFKLEEELKYDNSRLIDEETLFQVGYKFSPYFSGFVGDRYVRERKSGKGKMRVENRPTMDLVLSAPEFWTLKLDARTRFELRQKAGSSDYVRYRERLRLRTSWSVTDFKISPYFTEEFFFSDKNGQKMSDAFDRTRTQFGLSFKPIPSIKDLSASTYFMVQHDISHHPDKADPTNVFGFEISYKF